MLYSIIATLTYIYSWKFIIPFFERFFVAFYWAWLVFFDYKKYVEESLYGREFPLRK